MPVNANVKSAGSVAIQSMADCDVLAVQAFVGKVPVHDLLFLDRDIRQPKVLAAWRRAIEDGTVHSLVAVDGDEIVATTAVIKDPLSWSAHVADVRLLVLPESRGKGVGRALLDASIDYAIAEGATKLTARMTPDQRGAITLFEESGFRGEALLRDQVRDMNGELYDIAVLSLDVSRDVARKKAFRV